MPKAHPGNSPSRLVTVTGYQKKVDGTPETTEFYITSEKAIADAGALYPVTTVRVVPNPDGSFSVNLYPSSLVGTYTLQLSNRAFFFQVPSGVSRVTLASCMLPDG